MTKIMLVEDDNNLREIYEARLLAEGYEIVSAKDGEEALATAVKEKPDLIISDVMMPKISGFDMLDILRSTPETKNTKVIMMTALSQAEDKARADKLGADKYLVKSQVTLEDVARVAAEVISGEASPSIDSAAPAAASTPAPAEPAAAAPVAAAPIAAAPVATADPAPITSVPDPVAAVAPLPNDTATTATDELTSVQDQIASFESLPVEMSADLSEPAVPAAATPAVDPTDELNTPDTSDQQVVLPDAPAAESIGVKEAPTAETAAPPVAQPSPEVIVASDDQNVSAGSSKRVIQPINDLSQPKKNLADLAAEEDAQEAANNPIVSVPPESTDVPAADTVITPTNSDSPAL
jgi:CheY-like chemotaxis protein